MGSKDSSSSERGSRSPGSQTGTTGVVLQGSSGRSKSSDQSVTKVTILGAGGGIGQPLAMLLMLHNDLIQHVAMHDLIDSIEGIGMDVSHIDRRCKITTHLGPEGLPEAVKGAKVIIIPAGLAQKPGMTRDDLFASNAKIVYNIMKVCVHTEPNAMLAIITNPVNSLVPVACEVYYHHLSHESSLRNNPDTKHEETADENQTDGTGARSAGGANPVSPDQPGSPAKHSEHSPAICGPKSICSAAPQKPKFHNSFRRIFGVTTLDVVRASTLTARSALFKSEPNGMFKDPSTIKVPVVGGHAGRTIIPLLTQATPRLDRKKLLEDKATRTTLIESIQQAGIEVLNAKKGRGSATIAMAYSACRFTLSLLRAINGEPNIVECAYVHQPTPMFGDLHYFATPLLLGKEGFTKSLGIPGQPTEGSSNKQQSQNPDGLLPYEQAMLEEGAKELRLSVARGEDFVKERLSSER